MAASCATAALLTRQEVSGSLWAAFQNSKDCCREKNMDLTVSGTLMYPSLTGSQETQHCLSVSFRDFRTLLGGVHKLWPWGCLLLGSLQGRPCLSLPCIGPASASVLAPGKGPACAYSSFIPWASLLARSLALASPVL